MRYSIIHALAALGVVTLLASACAKEDPDATAANPCAANPCAMNPCGGAGAMPMIDAAKVTQGANALYTGDSAELLARGKELWSDPKLSSSGGISCASCHVDNYGQMQATFGAPYPHAVAMAKDRAGLETVNAAEMVQLCMMIPMNNEPLAWDSQELAALAAYVTDIQKGFEPGMDGGMNPCNPCAMKNPCGANPCAMKNPCATKNPCGAATMPNPCNKSN